MKIKLDISKLKIKVLGDGDLDEIMAVQEETFEELKDSDILRRNTKETFAVCFTEPSIAYGLYNEEEMVAFGMLYCAGDSSENLALSLDEKIDIYSVANLKVVIVRPKYRGNGLQKYLIEILEKHATENGYTTVMATVAPTNNFSMDNFIACGYKHVKTLKKYGGLERALLIKPLKK